MRLLLVGDVHGKVEDLGDCEKLRERIVAAKAEYKPSFTAYLGDLYDTHGVKNNEVERFWLDTVDGSDILLLGNHDRSNNAAVKAHALQVHRGVAQVVDKPVVANGVLFLPYYFDHQAFVAACQEHASETNLVICHQTFTGAKYDNGFYAKDGIDPALIPQKHIISGHIHTPMSFGKVWYPGSPRWQTVSDANINRHLWVIDVSADGSYGGPKPIPLDGHLRKLWSIDVTPEDSATECFKSVKAGDKVVVNLQGPSAFIEETKRRFLGQSHIRIRTYPTDKRAAKLSEVEGIPAAFAKHLASYQAKHGTSRERLREMYQEHIRG